MFFYCLKKKLQYLNDFHCFWPNNHFSRPVFYRLFSYSIIQHMSIIWTKNYNYHMRLTNHYRSPFELETIIIICVSPTQVPFFACSPLFLFTIIFQNQPTQNSICLTNLYGFRPRTRPVTRTHQHHHRIPYYNNSLSLSPWHGNNTCQLLPPVPELGSGTWPDRDESENDATSERTHTSIYTPRTPSLSPKP